MKKDVLKNDIFMSSFPQCGSICSGLHEVITIPLMIGKIWLPKTMDLPYKGGYLDVILL